MSKHTPGPWAVFAERNLALRIDAADKVVAFMNTGADEREANAHLIASAPEMLDVLKGFDATDFHTEEAWNRLQRIIVKAEGRKEAT